MKKVDRRCKAPSDKKVVTNHRKGRRRCLSSVVIVVVVGRQRLVANIPSLRIGLGVLEVPSVVPSLTSSKFVHPVIS